MVRLKEKYYREVMPALKEKLGYKNSLAVPRFEKIVINMGVGDGGANPKLMDLALSELVQITGQKAIKRKAKASIAGFKLRAGVNIGAQVTLRRDRMYEFFDRMVNIALPRVRDFRGISAKAFDGHGNYTLGIKEQTIFPEINYDKVERVRGMNVTIVTTAKTDAEAKELLTLMGMPFRE